MTASDSYRLGVGIMLINGDGLVFGGRRIDAADEAWQMPQGGIDAGETPDAAALRELAEETGVTKAEIIAESRHWMRYDLPSELAAKLWGGRYLGQRQKWFAMRFQGHDEEVDLDAHHAEFSAWKWLEPDDLVRLIIPFKRQLYRDIFDEFRNLLESAKPR